MSLLFLGVCMPAWSACSPPPDGLVAWWPGDGTSADFAGSHSAALMNGAFYEPGFVLSAFSFDGVDDYVPTPLDVQPSAMAATTWEAWVWPALNTGRRQILSTDDGGYDRSLLIDSGSFGVFTGTTLWRPVEAETETWQHIAVVFTPTDVLLYKNGVEFVWGSAPSGQSTSYPLHIGRNPGFGEFFAGLIDEVSVYDRALSSTEIQALATTGPDGKCKPDLGAADLQIAISANPEAVGLEQEVVYTLTLMNLGPDTANAIQVADQLPPGVTFVSASGPEGPGTISGSTVTLSLDSLNADASAIFEVRVRTITAGAALNHVLAIAREPDPNPDNNVAELSLGISLERIDAENGNWFEKQVTLLDTPEAELMVRVGDIDNLGFGWPSGFNPFSGNSTPAHSFPWSVDPADPDGTDRIMVVSSYVGTPPYGRDGYTANTSRPDNNPQTITLDFTLGNLTVQDATLQMFVDDYQSPVWGSQFQVWINGRRAAFLEDILNGLNQTGPIGKLISTRIPLAFLPDVAQGHLEIFADDPVTGAGDGFANDFAKLLINVRDYSQTGDIIGSVTDSATRQPLVGARVSASGIVETFTDDAGQYVLTNVPAGLVFIEVTKPGFESQTQSLDLIAGQTRTVQFSTQVIPVLWVRFTSPNALTISWPAALEGYQLYRIDRLTDGAWTPVETPVETAGEEAWVELTTTGETSFFRLEQP